MQKFKATHIYVSSDGEERVKAMFDLGSDMLVRTERGGVMRVAKDALKALKCSFDDDAYGAYVEEDSAKHWAEIAQNGRVALRMLREVIELCAPIGSVASEEYAEGPEQVHEAMQLIDGVLAMRREVTALNKELKDARTLIVRLTAENARLHNGDKTPKPPQLTPEERAEGEAEIARLKRGDY